MSVVIFMEDTGLGMGEMEVVSMDRGSSFLKQRNDTCFELVLCYCGEN